MYCSMRINMIMLGFSFLILSLISLYLLSLLTPLMFHKITFIEKEGGIVKETLETNVILCELARRFLDYCINSYVVFLPHHLSPLIGFRGSLKCQEREEREPSWGVVGVNTFSKRVNWILRFDCLRRAICASKIELVPWHCSYSIILERVISSTSISSKPSILT